MGTLRKGLSLLLSLMLVCSVAWGADTKAKRVRTNTGSFDGHLGVGDTTVQKSLDTLDDIVAGGDDVSIDGAGVTNPDFVSTGDVDFTDTANTITGDINVIGGNTLIVSANSIYTTIGLAMGSAAAGDTILVVEGVYDEAVVFSQNLLTLKAFGSIKNTSITQATGTVVSFGTKAGCVLDGFSVNLSAADNADDLAIYSNNEDATVYNYVKNCNITADTAGGAIALMAVEVDDGNFRMENTDVNIEQSNDHACYAFDIRGAHTHIFDNVRLTMVHNPGAAKGGRGLHSDGTIAYFRNCTVNITGNWTLAGAVYAIYGAAGTTYEENNTVSIVSSSTGTATALYTNDTTSYVTGNTVHAHVVGDDAVWGAFAGGTDAYVAGNNVSGDGVLVDGVTNLYRGGNVVNGTLNADTITEGGNAVYSSGETPSGELGGTYANITVDSGIHDDEYVELEDPHLSAATIIDPDVVQAVIDAVTILPIEAEMYPNGITITDCGIKTAESTTFSVVFEEWTAPGTHAHDLETVATANTLEAEDDATIGDGSGGSAGDCDVGSIIKVDLPETDTDELSVWIVYTINQS